MRRFVVTAALGAIIAAGAWALAHRDRIHNLQDALALAGQQLGSLAPEAVGGPILEGQLPGRLSGYARTIPGDRLRLATFCFRRSGSGTALAPATLERMVAVFSRFDLIAVQELRDGDQSALQALVDALNRPGNATYSMALSQPVRRQGYPVELAAFVFDTRRVRLDQDVTYHVADPDHVLVIPPYVGWFRTVVNPPELAFTFSAMNFHVDPGRAEQELGFLKSLFRLVRNDGRGEDDVIGMGNFSAGPQMLGDATAGSALQAALAGGWTGTRGTPQYDNILFDSLAVSEYLGSSGVCDFLREFNLSLEEALQVSEHLPVWAEFSPLEGGARAGRTAGNPTSGLPIER